MPLPFLGGEERRTHTHALYCIGTSSVSTSSPPCTPLPTYLKDAYRLPDGHQLYPPYPLPHTYLKNAYCLPDGH